MDAETLQTFLEEATDYLPTMRAGIIAYERDSSCLADLQTSRRQAHTIKGAALMVELPAIGEIAKELENDLKGVIRTKSILSEKSAEIFLSKILIIESHLNDLQAKLSEIATAQATLKEEHLQNLAVINLPPEALSVFDLPKTEALETKTENKTEDFEIDAEMLEVFAEEAEDLLRNITTNLSILKKTPNNREALLEIRRSSHTLKGSAGIIGHKKLSALAHRVEDLLDYLAENEIEGDTRIFELLLASTDCLSALAGGENSNELNAKIQAIYQSYDEILVALKDKKIAVISTPTVVEVNDTLQESTLQAQKKSTPHQAQIVEAPIISASVEERTDSLPSLETANQNRAVTRVSLDRLNDLFNLVGEMVISRSFFEERLRELEQQIEELHHTTRRLRVSTGRLETNYEASAPVATGFNVTTFRSAFGKSINNPLDSDLDEFDALEFDRYSEFSQITRELTESASDTSAINTNLDNLLDNLNQVFHNQRRLIEGMQENLLRLRMISLRSLTPRLERTVRVTAQEEGKLAELVIENESIEIDTEILDSFIEPLVHLLRNAVAHGIETAETRRLLGKPEIGKITLRVFSEGTHIVFIISDDGRGISVPDLKEKAIRAGFILRSEAEAMSDEDAYSLVYLPGLSTAPQVNQISGRGVGMNVVSSTIFRRQGTISITSEPQKGTSFIVRLPMSMAVTRALLVKAGNQTYAFPLNLIKQVTETSGEILNKAQRDKVLSLTDKSYSFFHFNELLGVPQLFDLSSKTPLIVLQNFEKPCVLAVDQILKTEEIVIKPLGSTLQNIPEFIGASVLGDGSVVPVMDLVYLLKKKEKDRELEEKSSIDTTEPGAINQPLPHTLSVLIVDDSPSVRQVNSNLIKNAGWQATVAKDGLEALDIIQTLRELPDVILTDVEMPRMDGYELLASLKRQPNLWKIPVIMITSRTGEKHRRKALDLGVDEYLTKPYEESDLLAKINSLAGAA